MAFGELVDLASFAEALLALWNFFVRRMLYFPYFSLPKLYIAAMRRRGSEGHVREGGMFLEKCCCETFLGSCCCLVYKTMNRPESFGMLINNILQCVDEEECRNGLLRAGNC